MAEVKGSEEVQLNDPQTLYRRWEDGQWSPYAINLVTDQEQWPRMGGEDRDLIFYVLSSLMVAEERITTKFSGLVGAYGTEEEATFLATQQVDEARHMQFYARFQDEVVAAPATVAAAISPCECPATASGDTPAASHTAASDTITAHNAGCATAAVSSPGAPATSCSTSSRSQSTCGASAAAHCASRAANTGLTPASSRPIPAHCAP